MVGRKAKKLTFFNDLEAPEHLGRRTIMAAAVVSPGGRWLAITLGIDFGTKRRAKIALKVALAEILKKGRAPLRSSSPVNPASRWHP